jgi:hypothetical protein
MREAVIFDMDGTLANVSSIRHHLKKFDETRRRVIKHFDRFHEESVNVPANPHVVNAAQVCHLFDIDVIIVTARKAKWRNQTAMWLALNCVPSNALFMRGNDDNRKDYEVKKDILSQIRKEWIPIHAWDDNPAIIKLWKEENIPCTIVEGWEHG